MKSVLEGYTIGEMVKSYLKVECDKLKIYIVNSRTTTKKI